MAAPADAQLVGTGLGPFYDGIGHFFLTPEAILPVLALALWGGCAGANTALRPCCPHGPRGPREPATLAAGRACRDGPAPTVRTFTWVALLGGGELGVESGATMAQDRARLARSPRHRVGRRVFATLATETLDLAGVADSPAAVPT